MHPVSLEGQVDGWMLSSRVDLVGENPATPTLYTVYVYVGCVEDSWGDKCGGGRLGGCSVRGGDVKNSLDQRGALKKMTRSVDGTPNEPHWLKSSYCFECLKFTFMLSGR